MSVSSVKTGEVGTSLLVGNTADVSDYYAISTVTVGSGGSSSITFSSIPSDYAHLQIRALIRTDRSTYQTDNIKLQFNSATANSNYTNHSLYGTNGSVGTSQNVQNTPTAFLSVCAAGSLASSNVFGVAVIDILDYANTNKNKTVRGLAGIDNNGDIYSQIDFGSGLYNSTSAITSIDIKPWIGPNFSQYSHFALYGIKG